MSQADLCVHRSDKRCILLSLPRELRDEIYGHALTCPEGLRWNHMTQQLHSPLSPALLYTCRQIRAEASGLATRVNTVVVDKTDNILSAFGVTFLAVRRRAEINQIGGRYFAGHAFDLVYMLTVVNPIDEFEASLGVFDMLDYRSDAFLGLRTLDLVDAQVLYALVPGQLYIERLFMEVACLRRSNPRLTVRLTLRFGAMFASFHPSFWPDLTELLSLDYFRPFASVAFAGLDRWERWVADRDNADKPNMAGFAHMIRHHAAATRRIEELQGLREPEPVSAGNAGSGEGAATDQPGTAGSNEDSAKEQPGTAGGDEDDAKEQPSTATDNGEGPSGDSQAQE